MGIFSFGLYTRSHSQEMEFVFDEPKLYIQNCGQAVGKGPRWAVGTWKRDELDSWGGGLDLDLDALDLHFSQLLPPCLKIYKTL